MKTNIEVTIDKNALEYYGTDVEAAILSRIGDKMALDLAPQLTLTRRENPIGEETTFSAGFVFMPLDQWKHVKKLLLAIGIFSDEIKKDQLNQVIEEIETR